MSTIMVRGPFTEDELAQIVSILQHIEAARPDETFEIIVDSPETETAIEDFIEKVNPRRPGYERVVHYRDRP